MEVVKKAYRIRYLFNCEHCGSLIAFTPYEYVNVGYLRFDKCPVCNGYFNFEITDRDKFVKEIIYEGEE